MARPRYLMLALTVGLAVAAIACPCAWARSGRLARVSLDLKDAPFEEALRQLFSGDMLGLADYVVESEPPPGAAVTLKATKMRATEALTLVLRQYDMTYRWVGHTVCISREGALPESEWGVLLYLRHSGDRTQVRLRAYPYESGGERLLWESPKDILQYAYCLPSPSFAYALVAWYGETYDETGEGQPWLMLVPLAGGDVQRIVTPQPVDTVTWTNTNELDIVGPGGARWRFDPSTGKLTREPAEAEDLVETEYAAEACKLADLLRKAALPTAFPTDRLESVCAAVHEPLNYAPNSWAPPQAALSPDGRYAALVGAEASVYLLDMATGAVLQKIPATRLVETEGVVLGNLHWSQNSTRLLFTESHLHAARYHTVGGPYAQSSSATDWTELLREYSSETGRAKTLTVGYDGYLVPAQKARELVAQSDPRDWQAADDQRRWGRYATDNSEGEPGRGP